MPSTALPPGLTDAEVQASRAQHGPNALADREKHGLGRTLRGVATEPMFMLLLVAAGIYLVLGDLGEGLLLGFFAVVTVGLVVWQERRSAHALDALRELAAPHVRVQRNGQTVRLPTQDLVPGDVIWLAEGERVAADGALGDAVGLGVDESPLTGESVPVRKRAVAAGEAVPDSAPGGDDSPRVYAGTLVVSGHGWARVTDTGSRTQVGRIGASLAAIEPLPTPLQQHLRRLVQGFGLLAVLVSGLLVLWWGLTQGEWMRGLLSAIALGMAMLPEEFPMALAVFLALGSWRLARIQVLARHPSAVEALGAATVLCVDKTGTLTENRMDLRRLVADGVGFDSAPEAALPEAAQALLAAALLASRRGSADPMDRAVEKQADTRLASTAHLHPSWALIHEYPLTPALLAMAQAWTDADGQIHVAAKGAPEAVFGLCHLPPEALRAWQDRVQTLADAGLRVLAVAECRAPAGTVPDALTNFAFELRGLLGFEDPLRPSVPTAMAQARQAGIAVAMITGDHAATALAIAQQAGIDTAPGALTGEAIAALDDTALSQAVKTVRVFARVAPAQKLRLVEALQRNGETVAMTGDGVNDAPALKAAHIGIAMGVRGTDVAREAAGLVLLDEDFGRIVGGVRMGRHIFDNLRKVMTYITAIHVPIVGLALLPLLMGLPPLMLPAHVVMTEMVIDPVCALAFEGAPESPTVMQRPPRRSDDGIVGWPMLWQGLLQGGCLLLATLGVYAWALSAGREPDVARTLAVLGLTAGNLMLVAANLSQGLGWRNLMAPGARTLWWVVAVASSAMAVAVLWAPARTLLHFGVPAGADLLPVLALVAGAVVLSSLLARPLRPT